MPHLTALNGSYKGRNVPLIPGKPFRIGRDPTLELSIDDSKASRTHVEIKLDGDRCELRDLRSKNGTLVNGSPITRVELKDGDEVQIGETRLVFSKKDVQRADMKGAARPSELNARPMRSMKETVRDIAIRDETRGFETLAMDAPLTLLEQGGVSASVGHATHLDREAGLDRSKAALCALYSIARACAESTNPGELLAVLTGKLQETLEADRVTPILVGEDGRWALAGQAGAEGARGSDAAGNFGRVPVSRTIVDYALSTRRSVLTTPGSDARFEEARSIGEMGITTALCVPIIVQQEMLGLIYADRLGGEDFDRADQELLTAACLQAAPALRQLRQLEEVLRRKERLLKEIRSQHRMLGKSAQIEAVHEFISRAAPTESVVLVLGESGSGKELVARAIHYQSKRRENPFVIVNCAALSESLIESELFGHAKGAFTGASADRKGRFEMAHEGTIFLDEIGELSAACQTKLLRVLEHGEISRVGEAHVRKVDVRLVAATNRELASEVKSGHFREDLFYRLNVLSIQLPPLRERGEDIRLLCEYFLQEAAARCARPRLRFSEEALELLLAYRWPGNVRELRNLTERLAVLCPQEIIGVRELPAEVREIQKPLAPSVAEGRNETGAGLSAAPGNAAVGAHNTLKTLASVEETHVLRVLADCEGNKKLAAEILGIDRSTLYAKLRAYGP